MYKLYTLSLHLRYCYHFIDALNTTHAYLYQQQMHTAVKIAPQYSTSEHPVIHVLDASRSVTVVSSLLGNEKTEYAEEVLEEYEELREEHYAGLEERTYVPIEKAIQKGFKIDFTAHPVVCAPPSIGNKLLDNYALEDVLDYIDWNPFFQTWELRGRYPNRGYPKIFQDATVGAEAQKLFDDAQVMLKDIVANKRLSLTGVLGIYPANRVGEDVVLYKDAERTEKAAAFCMLRQQAEKETAGDAYLSMADFIAPTGHPDHMAMFAVSCMGCDAEVQRFEAQNDDYSKIMAQALADRLVEAFAEALHADIRRTLWGFAPDEKVEGEDLFKLKYQGIRPAPGYPSQPDHTEKRTMWDLLQAEQLAGIQLSESLSMMPAASVRVLATGATSAAAVTVSALVFAHPLAEYFAVGKIGKDQMTDYAARKGQTLDECQRWLSPILNYDY
eukprot:6243-Heterococcus_DN1.PRE.3